MHFTRARDVYLSIMGPSVAARRSRRRADRFDRALTEALDAGDFAATVQLLEADASACSFKVLLHAVQQGDPAKVEFLLRHGVSIKTLLDAHDTGDVCLMNAAHSSAPMTTLLVDNGPLVLAVLTQDTSRVENRLSQGADVRQGLDAAFSMAAALTNLDIVRLLLKHGADVDARVEHGDRPLHNAILADNVELVRLLLKAGARVDHETAQVALTDGVYRNAYRAEEILGLVECARGEWLRRSIRRPRY